MVELSNERVDQILHNETPKTEELPLILRGIYTRYMHLYERYFADIDALNNAGIAALKKYHEETISLVKYYYMDIPLDICTELDEFDEEYTDQLLGPDWHKVLYGGLKEFKAENGSRNKSEASLKAEYSKQCLNAFYEAMDSVFRGGFNTDSKATESVVSGLSGLLFGKQE